MTNQSNNRKCNHNNKCAASQPTNQSVSQSFRVAVLYRELFAAVVVVITALSLSIFATAMVISTEVIQR